MLKKHVIGNALLDYLNGNQNAEFILHSDLTLNDMYVLTGKTTIPVSNFYKEINDLMEVDKQVLNQCYGCWSWES